MNVIIVPESSLKVGSDTIVVESCDSQPAEQNDGPSLNLQRSDEPEVRRVPTPILRPKKTIKIASFNIRTGKDNWRICELIHHMEAHDISIIGLQEHRRVHEEEIKYENIDGHLLVTSSAWRNSSQAAVGGVGFIMNRTAEKALCDVTSVTRRILKATLAGNPEFTLVAAYSPTNMRQNHDESDRFYESMRDTIDQTPNHNFLAILGDWNAKVSPSHVRFAHDSRTNENGSRLIDLACEKSLCITNTMFEKRKGKLWTFEDPKSNRYQLDYILVNSKWKNSVLNSEAYSSFESVGSDHRIVTVNIRLSLRVTKPPATKKRHDWMQLRYNPDVRAKFSIELRNRFNELHDESSSATSQFDALVKAKDHAASEALPLLQKCHHTKHASHPSIVERRKKVDQLTHKYKVNKSRIIRRRLQEAKNELSQEYSRREEETLQNNIAEADIEFQDNNTARAWKVINKITNRKSTTSGKLKGKSPEERNKQWYNHFHKLLGTPDDSEPPAGIEPVFENLGINTQPFTLQEVREAKKQLREGKAPGEDGIMPEVLKRVDIDDILLKFSNKVLVEHDLPDQLATMNIIPVAKKGDLSQTSNYRGIALTSLVSKLINRMILNRIRPEIDPLLRGNQSGFRPGRSTTSQVLALRRIMEGVRWKNLPAVMVFVDFCKAFDSISHKCMFEILKAYGIPDLLVSAIRLTYEKLKARVTSPDGETDYFKIFAGVMQGDTLAPFLFVIVLDYALRKAIQGREEELGFTLHPRRSRRAGATSICDLDFADDIVLLSNEIEQAKRLVHSVEAECIIVGLRLNAGKTKVMFFNTDVKTLHSMDGTEIKQALTDTGEQDFIYLGCWCTKDRDIRTRKALAWKSLHKLNKVWTSDMSREIKIELFRATTETILLYGSSTWTLTKQEEKALDGTYTRMLRKALNINWSERTSNDTLYGSLSRVSETIRTRRMKLAGHVFRDKSSPAHHTVTWLPTHGYAARGRPQTSFVDTLLHDSTASTVPELEALMSDRKIWRSQSRCHPR